MNSVPFGMTEGEVKIKDIDEYFTKEDYYADWRYDNLKWLKDKFMEEKEDEFDAFCRQEFKDRG